MSENEIQGRLRVDDKFNRQYNGSAGNSLYQAVQKNKGAWYIAPTLNIIIKG